MMLSSTTDTEKVKELLKDFDVFEIAKVKDFYKDVMLVAGEECDDEDTGTSHHVHFEENNENNEVEEDTFEERNIEVPTTKMPNNVLGKRKPESTQTERRTKPSKHASKVRKEFKRQRSRKSTVPVPVPVENILTPQPRAVKGNRGQEMNLKGGNERRVIYILPTLVLFDQEYKSNEKTIYTMEIFDKRFEFVKCTMINDNKSSEEKIHTLDRNNIKRVVLKQKKKKKKIYLETSSSTSSHIIQVVFLNKEFRNNFWNNHVPLNLKSTNINCSRIAIGNKVIRTNISLFYSRHSHEKCLHISSTGDGIDLKILIEDFEETGYFEPGGENLHVCHEIYNRTYFILRAKPTFKNGLLNFAPHYYKSLPPPKKELSRSNLGKRFIVIEIIKDKADVQELLSFVRKDQNEDITRYSEKVLQQRIISLISDKEDKLQPICNSEAMAVSFPKRDFEQKLYAEASSELIEASGKLRSDEESIFSDRNSYETFNVRETDVYGKDYLRLSPGEYLNDSIINFWCSWLTYRMGPLANDFFFLSTAFFTLLHTHHPKYVQLHTQSTRRSANIFEKKIIFVPVNLDIHWSLIAIMNPGKIHLHIDNGASEKDLDEEHPYILHFDSLRMHDKDVLQANIYKWLNYEFARCNKIEEKNLFSPTSCPVLTANVPKQNNTWDCGVFVCKYAFAMMQIIQKNIRIECTLSKWQNSHEQLIQDHIIKTDGFNFGMNDIVRLRKEIATLIENLYHHGCVNSADDSSVEYVNSAKDPHSIESSDDSSVEILE